MIEVSRPMDGFANDQEENMVVSVVDEVEAEKTMVQCDEPQHIEEECREPSTSSNSPPIDPSNTESNEGSSRSSAVRDSPRIQLSPESPCTSTSFSLVSSNRRSASPNSENEGALKLPSVDNSAGLSPTSTSSSFASSTQIDGQLQVGLDESPIGANASRKMSQAAIEKRHICEVCGKAFPYLSILDSHRRCHTGERPFSCHYCDKSFSQKATLQVHERTHTGERPYKCKFCPKTFAQYGTKTVHEKSSHLGVRNYKCPICAKCLSSPSALYTHKKTHGDKIFACPHCPKTFTLKNYLKLHVRQVHQQNDRRHVCRFCEKSFSYAGSLQVHLRTHTGERPYSCRYCQKAFASQGNLQSHEKIHTADRAYSCSKCNRSFIQKSQLTSHEATHLDAASMLLSAETLNAQLSSLTAQNSPPPALQDATQPKANNFVCKICGRSYAYASSLYVHVRLHTGDKPFKCEYCDRAFTSQGNLVVHLRSHTQERPYGCEGCGKCYSQKVGLKIHQEQCQTYLNRRGSVVTANESDSSPSLVDEDYIVVDEDKEPNFFLNAPVKPQPIQANNQMFSPPTNSQRESFSSDVFFPGTPLLSPTVMPGQQPSSMSQIPFGQDQQNFNLDLLARLATSLSNGPKFPLIDNLPTAQLPPVIPPQTTSSSLDVLSRQNELLFSSAALTNPTSTASANNNNYKESLNNLLMEQQLLQNLQKLQQLLQPTTPTTPLQSPLFGGLLNLPLPPQAAQPASIPTSATSMDLLSQLQMGSNMNGLLQSVLPAQQPMTPTSNLSASLAAALSDLARQQQPPALSQMFMN
ncbi:hypothetical protein M3Y97_00717300 [Aphelenchoides bicaudatus]|nr:hypothetical protein M3Y97_00717300 [Aphelenchoides bicaudatus]